MKSESKGDRLNTDSLDLTAEIRLGFPHSFKVQVVKEISGRGEDALYFPAARYHDRDGLLLQVTPDEGSQWNGLFAARPSGRYRNGIYSCPDPNSLCVVSNGAGYILNVRDPEGYKEVPLSPVTDVALATDAGLLIFASYTDVLAWDHSGQRWIAERVSADGIRNLRIDNGSLTGLAWSPVQGEHLFSLDLGTGASQELG